MQSPSSRSLTVGYVVSTWPRLSQTFVLNEIVALERLGLCIRIFSIKDPDGEPVHGRVAQVRADVTYLTLVRQWQPIAWANLSLACIRPGLYFKNLVRALRYWRWAVIRAYFQASYLASLLRRWPVTHLHAHFCTAPALVGMFASELSGVPYSFTAHARDIYVDTHPALLRAEMQGAKAVITVSEYNRKHLSTQINPAANGKVQCIHNGLDLDQFPFHCPVLVHSRPPVILSVARLIEKKGLGDLIDTAGILKERGCSFHLEIIGDGPLLESLRTQVEQLGLLDRVKLLGAQPQEVVRLAYQRAAIFALPCVVTAEGDRDGIPTALVEAMASGVGVVSTPVSGIPELIDHGRDGLLVAPNNPNMLAQALERLLTDSELLNCLTHAARAKVEKHFSIDRSSRQLLSLFEHGGLREEKHAVV